MCFDAAQHQQQRALPTTSTKLQSEFRSMMLKQGIDFDEHFGNSSSAAVSLFLNEMEAVLWMLENIEEHGSLHEQSQSSSPAFFTISLTSIKELSLEFGR